jgi:hypothetical protein
VTRYAVVPPVPALLPEYAGLTDPVADLRAAAVAAVGWLVSRAPAGVAVWGDPPGPADIARGVRVPLAVRVARSLLGRAAYAGPVDAMAPGTPGPSGDSRAVLVLANGTARRGQTAPGHLDTRAAGFDATVETALATGDASTLARLDSDLGADLWASGIASLRAMGQLEAVRPAPVADLRYAADPHGVRYWVVTWSGAAVA